METFDAQYYGILKKLASGSFSSPRKLGSKEIFNQSIMIEPYDNIITLKNFKTNIPYAAEELRWYEAATPAINFSPLIEKIWKKYSDDGITVNSNYGFRIWGRHYKFCNQWEWVKSQLKDDIDTRRAVININYPQDKEDATLDFPCCMYMHFIVRNKKLYLSVFMRSQDVYLGLRNDVYCFTELQKKMAKELQLGLGAYYHHMGSCHIYENMFGKLSETIKYYGSSL